MAELTSSLWNCERHTWKQCLKWFAFIWLYARATCNRIGSRRNSYFHCWKCCWKIKNGNPLPLHAQLKQLSFRDGINWKKIRHRFKSSERKTKLLRCTCQHDSSQSIFVGIQSTCFHFAFRNRSLSSPQEIAFFLFWSVSKVHLQSLNASSSCEWSHSWTCNRIKMSMWIDVEILIKTNVTHSLNTSKLNWLYALVVFDVKIKEKNIESSWRIAIRRKKILEREHRLFDDGR